MDHFQRWASQPNLALTEGEAIIAHDEYAGWYPYFPLPINYGGDLVITNERIVFLYKDFSWIRGGSNQRWEYSRDYVASVRTIRRSLIHRISLYYSGIPIIRIVLQDGSTIELSSFVYEEIIEELGR